MSTTCHYSQAQALRLLRRQLIFNNFSECSSSLPAKEFSATKPRTFFAPLFSWCHCCQEILAKMRISVLRLELLQHSKWRSRLWLKMGSCWLHDSDDQRDLWHWVIRAEPGDQIHRREELLYEMRARDCGSGMHRILLFNFEDQIYEALRITYDDDDDSGDCLKSSWSLNEMD